MASLSSLLSKARNAVAVYFAKEAKMARFSSMEEKPWHVRSISLPSTSHPITQKFEEEINKLKTWEASSTSSTSSLRMQTIHRGLNCLKNLYDCIEDFLQLPVTQQVISHHRSEKWVDELLDGSVMLLDLCAATNEILVSMKERAQDLLSALRRTKGRELAMENKVNAYIYTRKMAKKDVNKCITLLKQMNDKSSSVPLIGQDPDLSLVVRVQRELRAITISIFQALLTFISTSKPKPKPSKWSLVSKLMSRGSINCEGVQEDMGEVRNVDVALFSLCGQDLSKVSEMERMQKAKRQLETLEIAIKDLEAGLDCISKCLIQTRVTLLNILTR